MLTYGGQHEPKLNSNGIVRRESGETSPDEIEDVFEELLTRFPLARRNGAVQVQDRRLSFHAFYSPT